MKKYLYIFYSFLLLCFLIFSYFFVDPGLIYLKTFYSGYFADNRLLVSFIYVTFLLLFFALYVIFLKQIYAKKLSGKEIKLLIGLPVVVLFFSYPAMLSFDIFNYIATAKVAFFYHENPYVVMPIEFIRDPLLLFMHAPNKVALYAPFWIGITAIPHYLGFSNFLLTLFNFKLLIAGFYLGSVFLIWKISKNFFSVALFALNPLVIIETLVSAHNDIVMMFFALLSFHFFQKKSLIKSFVFLLLSIFVKYSTIFLLPVWGMTLWNAVSHKKIVWEKVWLYSFFAMLAIFILSPIREEIYPWYATWFLVFASLLPSKKFLMFLSCTLSFGLLLRYVPFMLLGTYFGPTPMLKIIFTTVPVILTLISYRFIIKKN